MTTNERQAAVLLIRAIMETIKESGEQGAPEGPMYAAVMGTGCSLNSFNMLIAKLEQAKLVRRSNHVCYWIGG